MSINNRAFGNATISPQTSYQLQQSCASTSTASKLAVYPVFYTEDLIKVNLCIVRSLTVTHFSST